MSAKPPRSVPIWVLFVIAGLAALLVTGVLVKSFVSTKVLESDKFFGIKPLEKETTSIIVVHGIGNHCIGYADPLIVNLMKELAGSNTAVEPIKKHYERYEKSLIRSAQSESAQSKQYGVRKVDGVDKGDTIVYKGDTIDLPRDGHCNKIALNEVSAIKSLRINIDTGDDLDTAVSAQDKLCQFINENHNEDKTRGVRANCYKLSVKREKIPDPKEREYITGFIRVFEKDLSVNRRVRVYEVTWSPATRWLKQSLSRVERFNSEMSVHWMNKFLKTEVMNAGIADAIAYLSEGGVLVNFDILQAFCLSLASEKSPVTGYDFSCDASQLQKSSESFSKRNDIFLISHSLGTRVVLDSIGLLSQGVTENRPAGSGEVDLVTAIGAKFKQIGAVIPEHYLDETPTGFKALLNSRIPEFAKAIRSVYIFTNQVPLLAATITSPFSDTYEVGRGFQQFLELRSNGSTDKAPLQIVSFHDPDDILSYNLSCWYHVAVLKNSETTQALMEREADRRANRDDQEIGLARRALRDKLFNDNCSKRKFSDEDDIALFNAVQQGDKNLLALKNATVRLRGWRIEALAASPLEVHSNYFHDRRVHGWLAGGHHGS